MAFLQLLQAHADATGGLTPVAPFVFSRDYATFLSANNLTFDLESGATWLLCDAVNRVNPGVLPAVTGSPNNLSCSLVAAAGTDAAAAVSYLADTTPEDRQLREGIPRAAFRNLVADRHKALHWLLDLAACVQVKPLQARNMANYFQMNSRAMISGRLVVRIINFAAIAIERISENNDLKALLTNGKFMEYHTAFSSSANLAAEMLEVCPPVTNHIFSAGSRAAVANSKADATSSTLNALISQQILLATHAYLTVFQKLPEAWYQGEKAVASLPANRYAMYKAVFKSIKRITVDSEAIDSAASIDALIEALGANLQGI